MNFLLYRTGFELRSADLPPDFYQFFYNIISKIIFSHKTITLKGTYIQPVYLVCCSNISMKKCVHQYPGVLSTYIQSVECLANRNSSLNDGLTEHWGRQLHIETASPRSSLSVHIYTQLTYKILAPKLLTPFLTSSDLVASSFSLVSRKPGGSCFLSDNFSSEIVNRKQSTF